MLSTHVPYGQPLNLGFMSGKALAKIDSLYVTARKYLGKFLLRVGVFFLLWPALLVFALCLKVARRKLIVTMRNSDEELHDLNDYVAFKESFDKFEKLLPFVHKVNSYNPKNAHYVLRYVLVQMQKTGSTLLTFHDYVKCKFINDLNHSKFPPPTESFCYRPEQDLWKNRNKAYSYWL